MQSVSTTEWLALGIFVISIVKAGLELYWVPHWFNNRKEQVPPDQFNSLIERKRHIESSIGKYFTASLAAVTAGTLFISFSSDDVSPSDIEKLREEVLALKGVIEGAGVENQEKVNE